MTCDKCRYYRQQLSIYLQAARQSMTQTAQRRHTLVARAYSNAIRAHHCQSNILVECDNCQAILNYESPEAMQWMQSLAGDRWLCPNCQELPLSVINAKVS